MNIGITESQKGTIDKFVSEQVKEPSNNDGMIVEEDNIE
jgi:hypothetical protein